MRVQWRLTAIAAILTAVAGFSSSANAAGDPQKGASTFSKCKACHRVGPGARAAVGPQLNGIVGKKAAMTPDYPYSEALKSRGLTWDDATLTQWLKSPRAFVPGTRMAFAGISKDEDIANVIAYLKTFDDSGNPVAAPAQ